MKFELCQINLFNTEVSESHKIPIDDQVSNFTSLMIFQTNHHSSNGEKIVLKHIICRTINHQKSLKSVTTVWCCIKHGSELKNCCFKHSRNLVAYWGFENTVHTITMHLLNAQFYSRKNWLKYFKYENIERSNAGRFPGRLAMRDKWLESRTVPHNTGRLVTI